LHRFVASRRSQRAVGELGVRKKTMELRFNEYLFTDDASKIDIDCVVSLLQGTYWAEKRERSVIERSIQNSLCFSVFHNNVQIGFARAVSDYTIYTLILDVVIATEFQKQGIGKKLIEFMTSHSSLTHTSQVLWTKDAQCFYEAFGFKEEPSFSVMFKRP
jgi:N-acetylglutamate synthase-like GNAT family acetyltransferase